MQWPEANWDFVWGSVFGAVLANLMSMYLRFRERVERLDGWVERELGGQYGDYQPVSVEDEGLFREVRGRSELCGNGWGADQPVDPIRGHDA